MGVEDSFITPDIIEKLISNTNTLKSLLGIDDEGCNIASKGDGLMINIMLCDVVIENVFAGHLNPYIDVEAYDKITIYFKPLCELSKELSSIQTEYKDEYQGIYKISKLLNKKNEIKQERTKNNKQIEEMIKQLEDQQKEKAIIETKIYDKTRAIKMIPKKAINKKFIFINRREIKELNQMLLNLNKDTCYYDQCLNELMQSRIAMEAEANQNIDEIIEILSEKYTMEKVDSI